MIYTLDTEFNYQISKWALYPLSVGLVKESGEELYIEFNQAFALNCDSFVSENVVPNLKWFNGDTSFIMSNKAAKEAIIDFVGHDEENHFYTWYGSYDWVMFCGIFGNMVDLPKNFPMYTRDLKYIVDLHKIPSTKLPKQVNDNHNALEDARWNMEVYKYISAQTFLPI